MNLEEVLTFIRNANAEMWSLIIREVAATRKRHDKQAARGLSVGTAVLLHAPEERQLLNGRILKINRGRVLRLGSISVGAKFNYCTAEILGPEYVNGRKPPFEGKVLTVVGFEPRYKNNVVVREPNGTESLLPLYMVEKALNLKSLQVGPGI